jgi:hypothetical protein
MTNMIGKAAAACGLAGALVIATAAPSLAQIVVTDPYYGGYGGPRVYAGPYGDYAYSPGYRRGYGYRSWDYPAGYDSSGMAYSYRDLGWQPGPPGAAPANPCYPGQRFQNRC